MNKISTLLKALCLSAQVFCCNGVADPVWDDSMLDLVAYYLPESPTILEAGAHCGEDTQRMKQRWPKSTIYAFEPNPNSYAQLETNVQHLTGVSYYPIALNDYNGECKFYVCIFNAGSSSLLELPEWRKSIVQDAPPIAIPCVTLDRWANAENVPCIDFIWLDVEGAELKVLSAGKETLKNVKAIYLEVNFQEYRKGMVQYAVIRQFLESQGFLEVNIIPMPNFEVQANALYVKSSLVNGLE